MTHLAPDVLAHTKKLVEAIQTCMITHLTPEGRLMSRPMTCLKVDENGELWFLASDDSEQTASLDQDENVNLAFAAPRDSTYLSITATAKILKNPAKIDELWNSKTATWFQNGKNDPHLCLIQVTPISSDFWDSPALKRTRPFKLKKANTDRGLNAH